MTEPHAPAARKWLLLIVVPVVLAALVIAGRRVEVADAAAASASAAGSTAGLAPPEPDAAAFEPDGDASAASGPASDVGADARRALEVLPDGAVLVDLNLASEDELRRLPGVGPGRARKILDLRARLGRLKSADDLARIKGFGRALLKRIRPLVKAS